MRGGEAATRDPRFARHGSRKGRPQTPTPFIGRLRSAFGVHVAGRRPAVTRGSSPPLRPSVFLALIFLCALRSLCEPAGELSGSS